MQISKPDIYLFNPTCEYAIANGNVSWQPNKLLSQMETDLGSLPLFFAQPNDIVLVNRIPSQTFLKTLELVGITPPNFWETTKTLSDSKFANNLSEN